MMLPSIFTDQVIFFPFYRLETLNEKRSGVVQMVKLAEKERDSLEVYTFLRFIIN